jgi:hypothetical protein
MSAETWIKLAELLLIIAQGGLLLFMLLMKGTFATRKQLEAVENRAEGAHHRQDVLDERLKGFPDYDVINEIKEEIGQVQQTQASGNTELRLLRETVQRMDDFLRHSR